jgi:hypothetical protein
MAFLSEGGTQNVEGIYNFLHHLKPEIHLKLSSCLTGNTLHFYIPDRLTLFREITAAYSENHTKPINTLCR